MACVETNYGTGNRSTQYNGVVSKKSLITHKDGKISERMNSLFHKNIKYIVNVNISQLLNYKNKKYDSNVIGKLLYNLYSSDLLLKCKQNDIDSIIIPADMGIFQKWYIYYSLNFIFFSVFLFH